jgi:hypothetical protein
MAILCIAAVPNILTRRRHAFERVAIQSFRPRRFAAAIPALVRSEIIFRSCSARDA